MVKIMEWTELQALWQQQDARIAENTRINKEILKRIIRKNPEKRLKWMKFWAVYGMVVPIPIVCIALIPNVNFRNEWDFYTGLVLLAVMLIYALSRPTKGYLLMRNIDFAKQITKTKKQLIQLEGMRLKGTQRSYLSMVIGLVGICLLAQLPVMTIRFAIVTIFIFLLAIVTNYIHTKRFKSQMNSFNAELNEIEQLETE
jgi:hypothetical protein